MPYIRMLKELRGKPSTNNSYNLEQVRVYRESQLYHLPLNLYNIWRKGVDYLDAIPPEDQPSQKRFSNGKLHPRTQNRIDTSYPVNHQWSLFDGT